ncbi:MAG: DUF2116 family Zn-ribbon domain-containing protein [Candidatus Methanoplasma sp.]|jgi:predicted nucleic acid-binding Zn ribbon protein|nr:DUF2116 family Zn-ribbon domain-containing protein [Candidatus Methanoplasma sp.]
MPTKLPEHDHCRFCGDPVPFDQAFCSEDCYYKEQARVGKEKKNNRVFILLTAVSVIAVVAVGVLV